MKTRFFLILILVLMISCGDENEPTTGGKQDFASYDFVIEGSEGGPHKLVGNNVDSRWDPKSGYIFLSTDDVNEPLGTLTITIGELSSDGGAPILDGLVSKTDVRVGTALELNARTFQLIDVGPALTVGYISNAEIGSNYIKADFEMQMERLLFWPEDEPEQVVVRGKFVAVD